MQTILGLIVILVLGYLSAHYLIGRLQTRFFILSGIEYILLGVLVGPHVTNVMTPEAVAQLSPIMSLAIGALGLLYGLRVRIHDVLQEEAEAIRLTFIEVLATFVLAAGAFWAVFAYAFEPEGGLRVVGPAALALGAAAAVSAPTALDAVRKRFEATGPLPQILLFALRYDRVLGIVLFGLIFCFFHEGQTTEALRRLTTTEWVAVSVGIGLLLGILFHLFLGRERNESKLLVALIGIVVFASGAAYYLNLSPLFINLVLGVVLANTSHVREQLVETLESIEQPIFVVILVFAGASWDVAALGGYPLVAAGLVLLYFGLRAIGKYAGGYLTYVTSEVPERLSRRLGSGLIAQGGLAVAMAVTFSQVYQNEFTNLVFTCVLVSAIVSEFAGPKLTKDMLVDAEQIALETVEG